MYTIFFQSRFCWEFRISFFSSTLFFHISFFYTYSFLFFLSLHLFLSSFPIFFVYLFFLFHSYLILTFFLDFLTFLSSPPSLFSSLPHCFPYFFLSSSAIIFSFSLRLLFQFQRNQSVMLIQVCVKWLGRLILYVRHLCTCLLSFCPQ